MKRNKITDAALKEAVINSFSVMEVLRKLNIKQAGGSHSHYSKRIKLLNLDTSHFTGSAWNRGKSFPKKKLLSEILILRTVGIRSKSAYLVRALIESGIKHECQLCNQLPMWFGSLLTLDVDHINENWLDDRLENLRFLCPNCHSQLSRGLIGRVAK